MAFIQMIIYRAWNIRKVRRPWQTWMLNLPREQRLCNIFLKRSGIWDLEASYTFLVLMYSGHSLCTTEGLMNIAEVWGQCSCRRVIIFGTLEIASSHQTFQTDTLLNKLSSSKPCDHRGNVEHMICWAFYYLTLCVYKSIKHKALGRLYWLLFCSSYTGCSDHMG